MMPFENDRFIYDVRSPLILEASAGSGKTTTLVERYLACLLHSLGILGRAPSESIASIVAITFTRKAAAEMKDRIVRLIGGRFESPEELAAVHAGFVKYGIDQGISLEQFLERCTRAGNATVDAVGFARITTIHSFGLNLLRNHPVETGVDPEASPDERASGAGLSSSDKDAFYNAYRKLIDGRDPDFAFLVGALGYETVRQYLEDLHALCESFGARTVEVAARESGYYRFGSLDEVERAIDSGVEGIRGIVAELTALKETAGERKLKTVLEHYRPGDFQLAYQFDWSYENNPLKGEDDKSRRITELRQALADEAGRFAEKLNASLFPPLMRCYAAVEKEIRRVRTDRKLITFDEIERTLLDALRGDAQFRDEAAGSVFFLLIDEYQDTSEIQFEIFRHFLFHARTTAFVVGDPKQSIYRFRNASVEVFDRTAGLFRERFGEASCGRLEKNYRSAPEVVSRVNRIFGELLDHYTRQTPNRTENEAGSGFYFLPVDEENKAAFQAGTAGQAASLIRQLIDTEGYLPRDILVLVRYKKVIPDFNAAMDGLNETRGERAIPYFNIDAGDVLDTPEIAWIVNYLRALDAPESDYHLLSLLKTPFFRKNDGDILGMMREMKDFPEGRLYEWMKKYGGREFDLFEEFRRQKNRLYIPDLVREIVERTGYRAFLNTLPDKTEAATNLVVFLDELRKLQDVELFDLTTYLYRLDVYGNPVSKPQVVGERSNVVRVMTVHSAKGLESPVVIFLAAGTRPPRKGTFVYDAADGKLGCNLVNPDAGYAKIFAEETARDAAEELRLAYVTFTRAKERFYYAGLTGADTKYKESWNAFFHSERPGISEDCRGLQETLGLTADFRRETEPESSAAQTIESPAERLEKLAGFRETYRLHPDVVTVTQLLDIEFESAAFPNKYLLKSFPVTEALNEIAEEDLFAFENPAADTGTLLHSLFERAGPENYEATLKAMLQAEAGGMTFDEAALTKLAKKFYGSEFYRGKIAAAVRTEAEWEINFPVDAGGSGVLVKGSIDKYALLPDGTGVLIDYKLRTGRNVERYARQLNYYAYILTKLGYPVGEMYLYDMEAGEAAPVEIRIEESGNLLERYAAEIVKHFTEANPLSAL